MAGFFWQKQYAAIADKELAIKLLNERCLECSICAMFFNSSLTVSIRALFLSKILSAILISEFFILFLTLVTSCMPLRKGSQTEPDQYIFCLRIVFLWCSPETYLANGSRSSTFPGVNMKLRISPLSLIIRCNLNPKNHPIEHLPRSASPSNVLWIRILWLRQTRKGWSRQNWCRYRFPAGLSWWRWSVEAVLPSSIL